jgi:transcriptional regulator with XRE-family HTH domain
MLGDRLKLLREQKNLKQQDVADQIRSTQQKISNYENNVVEPDLSTLIQLADFYNVSTDFLLERTDDSAVYHTDNPFANLPIDALDQVIAILEDAKRRVRKSKGVEKN